MYFSISVIYLMLSSVNVEAIEPDHFGSMKTFSQMFRLYNSRVADILNYKNGSTKDKKSPAINPINENTNKTFNQMFRGHQVRTAPNSKFKRSRPGINQANNLNLFELDYFELDYMTLRAPVTDSSRLGSTGKTSTKFGMFADPGLETEEGSNGRRHSFTGMFHPKRDDFKPNFYPLKYFEIAPPKTGYSSGRQDGKTVGKRLAKVFFEPKSQNQQDLDNSLTDTPGTYNSPPQTQPRRQRQKHPLLQPPKIIPKHYFEELPPLDFDLRLDDSLLKKLPLYDPNNELKIPEPEEVNLLDVIAVIDLGLPEESESSLQDESDSEFQYPIDITVNDFYSNKPAGILIRMVTSAFAQRNYLTANETFGEIVKRKPDFAQAQYVYALTEFCLGDYKDASIALKKVFSWQKSIKSNYPISMNCHLMQKIFVITTSVWLNMWMKTQKTIL
jgi:hypothetical protein